MQRFFAFQSFPAVLAALLLGACGGGSGGSSSPPPPVATHLSVAAPASIAAGTAFSLTVTALDASNNVVTGYSGTVHFTSTDAQAVLPANSALRSGTATFSATLKSAGGQTITGTDTAAPSITGTSSSIKVPGATHFSVTAPAAVTAGTAFNITVTALDASNNVVTGYSGTVHFTSTDAQAVLPANSALTNGTATLSATLKSAGGQTITGTDTAAGSITGTSSSIKITTATSRFQIAGSMRTARLLHTATLLPDGAVLISGGMDGTVALSSTELFDPASRSFTPSGDMHTAREWHTATLLNNGKVLITGGGDITSTSPSLSTAELYTPSTGTFTATGRMVMARSAHTATLLPGGKVLVTGGWDASGNVRLKTAELFDPSAGTFTLITGSTGSTGSMGYARAHHNATLLSNGKVLITGDEAQAELFDPLTQTFAATGSTYEPKPEGTATGLNDGRVLVIEFFAGNSRGHPNGVAQLYEPTSGTFVGTGGCFLCPGRSRHTATLRDDGTVLVAGGGLVTLSQEGQPPVVTASAELFDPVSGTFVATDPMVLAREYHTATLLNNGDVLITGGRDAGGNTLAAAELYH